MEQLNVAPATRADGTGGLAAARPIFLHAGWRSRGTWLWDRLRAQPGITAFYEPLHEDLADLTPAAIGHFRPDSWGSAHGDGQPYFQEFAPLMQQGKRGVRLYERRFAFDDFFLPPGRKDAALEAYLRQLLDRAQAGGRQPVLKFCRSLGRVAWMRERFPAALHAVLLRDPATQWRSSRRQMEDGNRYFVLAPFLIMERNGANPLLREAMRRLDVTAPARLGDHAGIARMAAWRHVQTLDWAQRYRGFLAVWAATAVAALSSGASFIDSGRLGEDSHRAAVEALLADAGVAVELRPRREDDGAWAWPGTAADARDAAAAALAALDFVHAHQGELPEDAAQGLAAMLTPRFTLPDGALATPARADMPAPAPLRLRQADAALYVVVQAALYPLRRAHYYLWRLLGWHAGPGAPWGWGSVR